MKWKQIKAEIPPVGWVTSTMTIASASEVYRGLVCSVAAVQNDKNQKWDAYLTIGHWIDDPMPDCDHTIPRPAWVDEIQNQLFWRDFIDPLHTKEAAISASYELGKEIIDGKHPGLNEFLISKRD